MSLSPNTFEYWEARMQFSCFPAAHDALRDACDAGELNLCDAKDVFSYVEDLVHKVEYTSTYIICNTQTYFTANIRYRITCR